MQQSVLGFSTLMGDVLVREVQLPSLHAPVKALHRYGQYATLGLLMVLSPSNTQDICQSKECVCVRLCLCLCVIELWLAHLCQDLTPMLLALSCVVTYNTVIVLLVIAPKA